MAAKRPPKKQITIYRNGERTPPIQFDVPPKTLDKILYNLTMKINLHSGGVRQLYHVRGHRIRAVEQLQDGECYVACGPEALKQMDYVGLADSRSPSPGGSMRSTRSGSSGPRRSASPVAYTRYETSPEGKRTRVTTIVPVKKHLDRTIYVFRNGDFDSQFVPVTLTYSRFKYYEDIRQHLTDHVRLRSGAVKRVYTMEGVPVHKIEQLVDGGYYIAGGVESVKLGTYSNLPASYQRPPPTSPYAQGKDHPSSSGANVWTADQQSDFSIEECLNESGRSGRGSHPPPRGTPPLGSASPPAAKSPSHAHGGTTPGTTRERDIDFELKAFAREGKVMVEEDLYPDPEELDAIIEESIGPRATPAKPPKGNGKPKPSANGHGDHGMGERGTTREADPDFEGKADAQLRESGGSFPDPAELDSLLEESLNRSNNGARPGTASGGRTGRLPPAANGTVSEEIEVDLDADEVADLHGTPAKGGRPSSAAPAPAVALNGEMTVIAVEGRALPNDGGKKADSYLLLDLGGAMHKTKKISSNANPVWNDTFKWTLTNAKGQDRLLVTVMDYDTFSNDDKIGELVVQLNKLRLDGSLNDSWYPINAKTGEVRLQFAFKAAAGAKAPDHRKAQPGREHGILRPPSAGAHGDRKHVHYNPDDIPDETGANASDFEISEETGV